MGGFTGRVPAPTLSQFRGDVADGRVGLVIVAVRPETTNPDLRWALAHCAEVAAAVSEPITPRCTSNSVHYGSWVRRTAPVPPPSGALFDARRHATVEPR